MGGSELLQAEHPLPAGSEVIGGGAAHPAEPDDDHVVTHKSFPLLACALVSPLLACALVSPLLACEVYLLIRAISGSTTGSECTLAAYRVPR